MDGRLPPPQEEFFESHAVRWRRWLPWLHLFRSFRIAIRLRQVVLGLLAMTVLLAGQIAISYLPYAPAQQPDFAAELYGPPTDIFIGQLRLPLSVSATRLAAPEAAIADPAFGLLRTDKSWAATAWYWTHLLWALAVWGWFGIAIVRHAAVEFAASSSVGFLESLGFAAVRTGSSIAAPLLPLVAFFVFWGICLLLGLVGLIPTVGPAVVGGLWFVPLILGFLVAVILVAVVAGWPLMVCTLGVEGTDAFDALSRSYSYLWARPWYTAWIVFVSAVYGTALLVFVSLIALLSLTLADVMVGTVFDFQRMTEFGATAQRVWQRMVDLLILGFCASYFWTAATIGYFLLRKCEDAVPVDEIWLGDETDDDALPLVGVAAAEHREQQRAEQSDQPAAEPSDPVATADAPVTETGDEGDGSNVAPPSDTDSQEDRS